MKINFVKMHGCGNDFIILEDLDNKINNIESLAPKLCHRHFGIGADGIILVRKSNLAHIKMEIINSDGSYAAMCGNGIRCFAKYVWEKNIVKQNNIIIETGDGIKIASLDIENEEVKGITIDMGSPEFKPDKIPVISDCDVINKTINIDGKKYNINSVLMGVPHTVIFGNHEEYNVLEGELIERFHIFPQGTNVNFVEVINRGEIKVSTWERGAGVTLACGTGSCASVVVGNRLNLLDEKVKVHVPGGILEIKIKGNKVFMKGNAEFSFEGACEI